MDFSRTETQKEVAELATKVLGSTRDPGQLWTRAADAGLLGVAVAEDVGGSDQGLLAWCSLLGAAGATAAPIPLWAVTVAAMAIDRSADPGTMAPMAYARYGGEFGLLSMQAGLAQTGLPFEILYTPGTASVPASQGVLHLPGGQKLNLDPAAALWAFGGAAPAAGVPFPGAIEWPFSLPATVVPFTFAFQAVITDPVRRSVAVVAGRRAPASRAGSCRAWPTATAATPPASITSVAAKRRRGALIARSARPRGPRSAVLRA